MKGMFSIDIEQVGTFASYNKTGFKNINEKVRQIALQQKDVETIDDKYVKDKKGEFEKLIRLGKAVRKRRITETIKALKTISGGAMQTSNLADVTPKLIVLGTTKSGNHPFSHIISNDPVNHEQTIFNIEDFKTLLTEYKDQFIGNIYIGRRTGFWNESEVELKLLNGFELEKEDKSIIKIIYSSVFSAIDSYCTELEKLIK
jgi:CRISPR-associated protein Cst2